MGRSGYYFVKNHNEYCSRWWLGAVAAEAVILGVDCSHSDGMANTGGDGYRGQVVKFPISGKRRAVVAYRDVTMLEYLRKHDMCSDGSGHHFLINGTTGMGVCRKCGRGRQHDLDGAPDFGATVPWGKKSMADRFIEDYECDLVYG